MIEIVGYFLYNIIFQSLILLKLVIYYYQLLSFKTRNIISQLFMYLYIKTPNNYIDYINTTIDYNKTLNCSDNDKKQRQQQQQQQSTITKNKQQQQPTISTPKHLALILNHRDQIRSLINTTETINFYNKISEILIWSVIVGIKRITIFDNHGSLKKNISVFQNLLDNKIKPFNNNNNNNTNTNSSKLEKQTIYRFNWLNNFKTITSNVETSDINSRILNISIVTVEDGKQELINITKKYINDSKVNSNLILNELYVNSNLPNFISGDDFEPEVALDFSDKHLFSGFLPWHIKLTEFIKMDHFNQFYLERFHQFLKKYNSVQKRCGK
ncbi:hypothetical protein RB653_009971 [Dictyostelium firmibasis]|uniref:ditrans,polycis-polyprenyl diphosphate synthase [(2E,6E)-farnesyldiphosphate specific] n=1 Tax=Dictyostelium firmibasis TaxID=79012 RepID=A0AAN7TTB0_9MYCE